MAIRPSLHGRIEGLLIKSIYDLVPEPPSGHDSLSSSAEQLKTEVKLLQDAGLSMLILDDEFTPATEDEYRTDATVVLSFLSQHAPGMGLIPGTPVAFLEPFHVAKRIQTLDYATRGFAGWMVSNESAQESYQKFDASLVDKPAIDEFTEEFIEVVVKLWDSWEHNAIIRDREKALYLNPDKVHHIHHYGKYHNVRGPSLTPRSPQGRPPIFRKYTNHDASSVVGADVLLVSPADAPARGVDGSVRSLTVVTPDESKDALGPLIVDGSVGNYRQFRSLILEGLSPRGPGSTFRERLALTSAMNQYEEISIN